MRSGAALLLVFALTGCATKRSHRDYLEDLDQQRRSPVIEVQETPATLQIVDSSNDGALPTLIVSVRVPGDSIPPGETLSLGSVELSSGGSAAFGAAAPYPLAGGDVDAFLVHVSNSRIPIRLRTSAGELGGYVTARDWIDLQDFVADDSSRLDKRGVNTTGIFGGVLIAIGGMLGFLATSDAIEDAEDLGFESGNMEAQRIGWISIAAGGVVVAVSAGLPND